MAAFYRGVLKVNPLDPLDEGLDQGNDLQDWCNELVSGGQCTGNNAEVHGELLTSRGQFP